MIKYYGFEFTFYYKSSEFCLHFSDIVEHFILFEQFRSSHEVKSAVFFSFDICNNVNEQ